MSITLIAHESADVVNATAQARCPLGVAGQMGKALQHGAWLIAFQVLTPRGGQAQPHLPLKVRPILTPGVTRPFARSTSCRCSPRRRAVSLEPAPASTDSHD